MVLMDYQKIINDNLNTLIDLLKIKSVYDEKSASETMPFGKSVYDALLFMKKLAIKDGFTVSEYDGNAISFEIGEGDKRIDIVSHLDVVAAKDSDFNIRIIDGKLYGRGTSDMKVPMFLTYLSLKLLKDNYSKFNKRIRIVLGCDEERTMNDMKYYVSKAGYPDFAFTPDGTFPMGIGEKGALMWTIKDNYDGIVEYLDGGTQCNIISPYASCILKNNDYFKAINKYIEDHNIDASIIDRDGKSFIEVKGIAAHASRPHLGHNATVDLLGIIGEVCKDDLCINLHNVFNDYYGKGFNSYYGHDDNCLSVNLGRLHIENNKVDGQIDSRYPFEIDALTLTERLKEVCKVYISLDYNDEPTKCDIDDIYVKRMLDTYREITNDNSKPIISGGVSYSKVFKHCVSYGPNELDKPSLAHQDGEYVLMDDIYKWFKIYYRTIEDLLLMEI